MSRRILLTGSDLVIEPHGLLLGHRSYLVARQPSRGETILNFRMDRIHTAEALDESFAFAPGFALEDYAAQAFGVYQDPAQYGEVIWRFAPEVASRASEFRFHPTQALELQDDGSLIVKFHAAGWLEMAWHLYQWGNKVEVVAPEGLRSLVEGYPLLPSRQSDSSSLVRLSYVETFWPKWIRTSSVVTMITLHQ